MSACRSRRGVGVAPRPPFRSAGIALFGALGALLLAPEIGLLPAFAGGDPGLRAQEPGPEPGVAPGGTEEPGGAPERRVLANQVTVAPQEASLRLEFSEGPPVTIAVAGGRLVVDGTDAGRVPEGGLLDDSWRELLGRIVAATPEEIPSLLRGWTPPSALPGESAAAAARMTTEFAALTGPVQPLDLTEGSVRIHVREEVTIPMGEVVPGSILGVESRLELDGRVLGDVILIGGALDLGPDAQVEGNVRWSGARIEGATDAVAGRIQEVPGLAPPAAVEPSSGAVAAVSDLEARIRREVEEATSAAARRAASRDSDSAWSRIVRGFGGLLQTAVTFGILLGAGLALLYFFPRRVEVIARTARASTVRSGLVGLAGIVLAVPLWVVGLVLLAVSIIGIPLILLWAPAVPLAVGAAIVAGYLAVAHNLGRWISGEEPSPGSGTFGAGTPATHIGVGLLVLLGAFAVANVFEMGGAWFRVFEHVLLAVGVVTGSLAVAVGFGAVILSRGGQDPTFAGPGTTAGFDPFTEPTPGGTHG